MIAPGSSHWQARRVFGLVCLLTSGCAAVLGIDHDYSDQTAAAGSGGSSANGPGGHATAGDSALGGSSSDGGTGASNAGRGGVDDGGAAGVSASGGTTAGASGGSTGGTNASGGAGASAGGSNGGTAGTSTAGGATGSGGSGGSSGSSGSGSSGSGSSIISPVLKVQTGSTTLSSGSNLRTVTLDGFQLERTFLVFGAQLDSTAPLYTEISGQLAGGTSAVFKRISNGAAAPDVPIVYYAAEFAAGVQVQRGTTATTAATNKIALTTPVDLKRSFPIVTYRNSGTAFGLDDHVRAKLSGSSELALSLYQGSSTGIAEWQVVTFDGATVQTADVQIPATAIQTSAALATPLDPAKSWLLVSYQVASVGNGVADLMLSAHLESGQVVFDRVANGDALQVTYYAVSFDNGTSVQSGVGSLAAAVDTQTQALTAAIDPTRSIATAAGQYQREGSTSYNGARNPGYASFTLGLGSKNGLVTARMKSASGANSSVSWSVTQFQ